MMRSHPRIGCDSPNRVAAIGATETGEAVAVHLEPLTGKLIALHVGSER